MSIYFTAENGGKRFAGYHSTKIYAQRSVCGSQSIVEYCSASYDLESFGTVLSIITNIECNKTLTEIVKVITTEWRVKDFGVYDRTLFVKLYTILLTVSKIGFINTKYPYDKLD